MKVITIHQPWASLIAVEAKRYETRSWKTNYRGRIAIHAGKKPVFPWFQREVEKNVRLKIIGILAPHRLGVLRALPLGKIIATADLVECWEIRSRDADGVRIVNEAKQIAHDRDDMEQEFLFGDWTPGRYAWELANVEILPEPLSCKGQQGMWNWEGLR